MRNENHSQRRVLIYSVCVSLLLVCVFAVSSSLIILRAQKRTAQKRERTKKEQPPRRERDKKEPERDQAEAAAKRSTALVALTTDSAAELGRDIERAIGESRFAFARWGVFAVSLRDGRVLYARDADKTFTPASNMKVYTTAVALDLLGADYRWRTSVYSEAAPDASGTIKGDIILYGRGAPDLASRAKRSPGRSPDSGAPPDVGVGGSAATARSCVSSGVSARASGSTASPWPSRTSPRWPTGQAGM